MTVLLVVTALAALSSFVLSLLVWMRRTDLTPLASRVAQELARARDESRASDSGLRQEVAALGDLFARTVREQGAEQRQELERIRGIVDERLKEIQAANARELQEMR